MVFDRFIELIMPPDDPLFDKIIATAGNHDHHLWLGAKETQYVKYITSGEFPPDKKKLPDVWNATNIFTGSNPLPSYFLQNLVGRFDHLKDLPVHIAYPTFGLLKPELNRAVIINHGHYIESIYLLMSELKTRLLPGKVKPADVWDIEAENGAWIDFFWSAMGDAGGVGEGIETIYDKLDTPDEVTKLICNLVESMIDKESWLPDIAIDKILFYAFSPLVRFISNRERSKPGPGFSEDAQKGLRWYMSGPVLEQLKSELAHPDQIPDVTFLFGHTHKPFTQPMKFTGFSNWVHTYNTGGWVVDTPVTEPGHGGAMVLIDENLESVSVRMYNEADPSQEAKIFVETSTRGSQMSGQLFAKVDKLLKTKGPWQSFPAIVAEAVSVRREHLRNRIHGNHRS